jgi:hypothetical protein
MKYLIIMTLALILSNVSAQEPISIRKHQIGANAGFTTGLGLSYRYWPKKFGIQATVLPIKKDDQYLYSFGVSGYYGLTERKYIKTFLYLGNHLVINEMDDEYNIGAGYGFAVGTVITFNLMVGYGLYDVYDTFSVFPTLELGLYYKLKN